MKRLLIVLLFICPSAFSAYSEMIIEGVKQSNGVWTTAGVMDTAGFVRTTGAVTVAGTTASTSLALAADLPAATTLLKAASRAAGPLALAATAIEVYDWINADPDVAVSGNQFVTEDTSVEIFGYYWQGAWGANTPYSSANASCQAMDAYYTAYNNPELIVTSPTTYTCRLSGIQYPQDNVQAGITRKTCTTQQIASCQPRTELTPEQFNQYLPTQAPIPVIIAGWTKIPALIGQPTPITSTSFPPFSEWASDPYFKDGNWWRDRMDVSPAPTPSQPTRVRIDIGPVKLEGMTDPATPPADTPASGNTQPKEQTKFCDDNPQSIACQELGTAEPEPIVPDEVPFQLDTSQSWGASNASCPASPSVTLHTGKVITFNYQPTCNFLAILRPIIIAFAVLTAIFIAIGRTD